MGWDGMGWNGMDEWGEGEKYSRDQIIPYYVKVISAHWLLTHIQSPPLRLLRNVQCSNSFN